MAHPQARVAALRAVGAGAAPVLGQEQSQAAAGTVEVRRLGVQRRQHIVLFDAVVEGAHQPFEELHASDGVVQRRFDFLHPVELRSRRCQRREGGAVAGSTGQECLG